MDLTEAEDIKQRWQEYTEELYKKDLHNPDNHDGVIAHLEPDILECEVKGALGSITMNKASGGDGFPVAAAAAAKSLQSCPTLCDPMTAALLAPLFTGFSRQEHWSGLLFPPPGIPVELFQILEDDAA